MQQKTVSLGRGESLDINWGHDWSNLSIHQRGQLIGSFQDKAELKLGKKFKLPDGQDLTVLLREGDDLEMWHGGKELVSGTRSGQVDHFRRAVNALQTTGIVQFVAIPILLSGWMDAESVGYDLALRLGIGAVFGLGTLLGLSTWAKRTGNKAPFWIGILFCIINYLAFNGFAGTVIAGILIYFLAKGIQAKPPQFTRPGGWVEGAPLDHNL